MFLSSSTFLPISLHAHFHHQSLQKLSKKSQVYYEQFVFP